MADLVPQVRIEKEFDRKRAYDILLHLERDGYDLPTCEWAIRAYASIAGTAMLQKNTELMADFLDDGGCESLVNIMHQYSEISDIIASYGCLTIDILAWSLREMKEFLGEIGACEILVFALSMHIGDSQVSEFGTRAIGQMAKQNISNSFRLAEAGACDVLAQAGNFGFNIRHEKSMTVASAVCFAFAQLAEAVNAKRLADCGTPALICELTKLHMKSVDFAECAMKAICALSSLNAVHREELGRYDACKFVVDMMYLHDSTHMALEGCEAIMHLSLSPNNADKLGEVGGCEAVVLMLRKKLMEVDFGAEVCTGAMLNLATYGVHAKENRERLRQCQVVEILRKTQFSPKASYKARENISALLESLGAVTQGLGTVVERSRQNSSAISPIVSVIHGSEMKGSTVPLRVEVREEVGEYDSFANLHPTASSSPDHTDNEESGVEVAAAAAVITPTARNYTSNKNGVFEI